MCCCRTRSFSTSVAASNTIPRYYCRRTYVRTHLGEARTNSVPGVVRLVAKPSARRTRAEGRRDGSFEALVGGSEQRDNIVRVDGGRRTRFRPEWNAQVRTRFSKSSEDNCNGTAVVRLPSGFIGREKILLLFFIRSNSQFQTRTTYVKTENSVSINRYVYLIFT